MLHLYLPCFFFGCLWTSLRIFPLLICCMSVSPPPFPIALQEPTSVAWQFRNCFLSPEVSTPGHAASSGLEVEWWPLAAAMAMGGCSPGRGLCGPAQGLCSLVSATRHWGPVQELFWESCRKEAEEDMPVVVLGMSAGYQNPNELKGKCVLHTGSSVSAVEKGQKSARWEKMAFKIIKS